MCIRDRFHDPALHPQGVETTWLTKRLVNAQGDASYFDAQGRAQFAGTGASPDVVFDAAHAQHDRLMNDPQTGWFKSLKGLARILKLRVYGATRPGLLCTVEVTAGAGHTSRVTKTVSVEFGAYAVPALHLSLIHIFYSFVGALPFCYALAYVGLKMGEHWNQLRQYFHHADLVIGLCLAVGLGYFLWSHWPKRRPSME